MISALTLSPTPKDCHPERSPAVSEANRRTESKDPCNRDAIRSQSGSFRIAIRFFDEGNEEVFHDASRGAATECGPRHKP